MTPRQNAYYETDTGISAATSYSTKAGNRPVSMLTITMSAGGSHTVQINGEGPQLPINGTTPKLIDMSHLPRDGKHAPYLIYSVTITPAASSNVTLEGYV